MLRLNPDFGLNGTNRMFMTYESNLVVAMDSEADGEFRMRVDPITEKKVLVDANFKRGCQIQFVDLVVEFTLVP